jgi:hypothetical protein
MPRGGRWWGGGVHTPTDFASNVSLQLFRKRSDLDRNDLIRKNTDNKVISERSKREFDNTISIKRYGNTDMIRTISTLKVQ